MNDPTNERQGVSVEGGCCEATFCWVEGAGALPRAQKLSSTGLGFQELEAVRQREAICQKGSRKDSELTEAGAAVL